ncbi:hypothetical protein F5888DRAFT_1632084 [Russula emetica]|nr:hypothetical protein F5888DRAFT_1632084 [Russula emetica]
MAIGYGSLNSRNPAGRLGSPREVHIYRSFWDPGCSESHQNFRDHWQEVIVLEEEREAYSIEGPGVRVNQKPSHRPPFSKEEALRVHECPATRSILHSANEVGQCFRRSRKVYRCQNNAVDARASSSSSGENKPWHYGRPAGERTRTAKLWPTVTRCIHAPFPVSDDYQRTSNGGFAASARLRRGSENTSVDRRRTGDQYLPLHATGRYEAI